MLRSVRISLLILAVASAVAAGTACPCGDLSGNCLLDFEDIRWLASPGGDPSPVVNERYN